MCHLRLCGLPPLLASLSLVALGQNQPQVQDARPPRVLIRRGPLPHAEPQGPMVTFEIVALDNRGTPVTRLPAQNLRIYDDGKPLYAAFCRPLESGDAGTRLGPREYSNRPIRGDSRSTLILLDLLNADLMERNMGGNEIVQALTMLEPGQRVYVYLLTRDGTLYPVHALPGAASPIAPEEDAWVARFPAQLDEALRVTSRLRPQEFQADADARVRRSVAVLEDLAADLAAQPGRKSLVWIAHIPTAPRAPNGMLYDYRPSVQTLATHLVGAGVAVYTVDQTGRLSADLTASNTLQDLATITGGHYFPPDAAETAIRQALGPGPANFQVGYRPPVDRWDNKFHKLRVTADIRGNRLTIRAPRGYFGDAREGDPSDRFARAVLGPSDASDIGIRAAVTPSEKVRGWLHIYILVDAADLKLTRDDTADGEFGVTFAYYTTAWQSEASVEIKRPLHLNAAELDAARRDGVALSFDRPVAAGVRKLRIVVRDTPTGNVGSLTVPLAPPED